MKFFEAFVDELEKISQVAGTQQAGAGATPIPMFKQAPLMTSMARTQMLKAQKQMAFAPTLPTGQAPASPPLR